MTTSERKAQPSAGKQIEARGEAERRVPHQSPGPQRHTVVLHGRPRSVEGEEAYLRSMMEQAATDIAAGW